jgi:predicted nucleic acid-binding protein
MWLIDTDILIDHLRGNSQALKFLENVMTHSACYISAITIAELYVGVREGKERQILDQLIKEFQIAPLNEKVAQRGGLYRRDYGKSHGVGLADAIIAATAEDLGLKLVTLNKKHYPMLKKIHIPYQKHIVEV